MKSIYMTEVEINRVKGYMVSAGLNIGTLAAKLNTSRSTMSKMINGLSDWSREEMVVAAKIMGNTPGVIFFGEEVR